MHVYRDSLHIYGDVFRSSFTEMHVYRVSSQESRITAMISAHTIVCYASKSAASGAAHRALQGLYVHAPVRAAASVLSSC